jgi:alkanesulfonate monooxygenase SsuD/methylene tetrahydromethanopterin reductase-like flavin-dependent oxidoreductase (luciferase family)
LRIGTFGSNKEGGMALTKAPTRLRAEWAETLWAAQTADALGFEAIVPVSRWKDQAGSNSIFSRVFDTITWAAGIAASTRHAVVFSTIDMGLVHPVIAAKQLSTIDHISGGRAAANVVAGWNRPEAEMFGREMLEHDARYDSADEWITIVKELWSAPELAEVDFEGRYYQMKRGLCEPKPLQKPYPPIMNAGSSERAHPFIAQHADLAFAPSARLDDLQTARSMIDVLKSKAAAVGREIQVWTYGYVVSRDTREEAKKYLSWYRDEHGDVETTDKALQMIGLNTAALGDAAWSSYREKMIAGGLGLELLGTPDDVVEGLQAISEVGFDGILLAWPSWRDDLPYFGSKILPRMEAAGLREPSDRT